MKRFAICVGIVTVAAIHCFAGQRTKWDDLPAAVQKTVLANGGVAGPIDKESFKVDGKTVYEAQVKDKDGNVKDLEITDDGKLVQVKTDDAADASEERTAHAKKLLAEVKFSHPREITNPYLPLANVRQDVLEGKESAKKIRIERTAKPDVKKTFKIGDQTIESLAFEDREFENDVLAEVALDYFAQDDNGTVYYLGEDVDEYQDGKVVGHEGSWLFGKDTPCPGILFPAKPKVGDKYKSEDVSNTIDELDEVVSISESVTTPAGTYKDCVKIKEHLADGTTEYKYFAKGVGVVREVPPNGDVLLVKHTTKTDK